MIVGWGNMNFKVFNFIIALIGFFGLIIMTIILSRAHLGYLGMLTIFAVMFLAGYLKQHKPEDDEES